MPTLSDILKEAEAGKAITSGNLCLIALRRKKQRTPAVDYLLASKAFERGLLRVTEVDEGGRVSELRAINEADMPILFLDGEELIGAKQNRILNTDVLMKPRSEKRIPVSCVEAGRWRRTRPDFQPGGFSPPPMRARKSSSVSLNLESTGMASSNQGEVWDEVDCMMASMDCSSETMAMADAFDQRSEDLDGYVTELQCPDDAVGFIALVNGQFQGMDLFDRSDTLKEVWPRLIAGYAAVALARRTSSNPSDSATDAGDLLRRLSETEYVPCPGVDLGEDWRFDSSGTVGSALVAEGEAMHLSAFPKV